ncbi:AAA family ATPase [Candidatus Amarolinea dominans]|uniref:AAA family ATPase n=1 Tax=Candidatus Amarolinea dominans TaxID=3140696 RepID=UPI0031CCBCAC
MRQHLGPFQVLIGPNASGKSTFLDVIAFLADVVRERGSALPQPTALGATPSPEVTPPTPPLQTARVGVACSTK